MEKKLSASHAFRNGRLPRLCAVGLSLLFLLALSGTAYGQQIPISGTVTSTGGAPLPGVTVRVQGTDTRTITDATGRYRVSAPADAILTFSFVGQRPVQTTVAGRNVIDVTMAQVPYLEQVVVTAYTEQRRADITGAVSSVDIAAAQKQTGASVLQRLDAAVPGVTVVSSGSPGSRSTVRIRGISSFQNNDPLYVIDGTPVQESYLNFLNPNDITSVQVLKDASAASIYGSRASNGVILIETTKKGIQGPPQATLRVRTGVATATRGYDDFLITNSLDYFQVMKLSFVNAGLAVPTNIYGDPNNPTVPQYIYASPAATVTTDQWGRPLTVNTGAYSYPNSLIMPGSAGTNWWKAVFGSAPVGDYNLDVNGGSDENAYRVSFNYFHQGGTAKYNDFKRGSVRANTQFNRGKLNFGENISLGLERHYGGLPDDPGGYAEDGILGKNILSQPVIPVYDISGNFAGAKAQTLGNQSNPLKFAFEHRNDIAKNVNLFGNVFAGLDPTPQLSYKSKLGFSIGQNSFAGFNPIFPENAEASFTNSINENTNQFTDWGWSNTLRFVKALGSHNFDLLVGQEAGQNQNRYIQASMANLLNSDVNSRYIQDALGDASTKDVFSTGGKSALLSVFGKADYNFADKYVASFTVRRDGSSRLAPGHQWGTFPAFGLGWRLTNERFIPRNNIFSDIMLRYGVGITGNQLIPSGRIVAQFGGSRGDTYYDVTGSNNTVAAGFRETSLGNPDLKWEENRSTNVGADMVLFNGAINFVVDVYRRATNNLLFDPQIPATAGIASPPIVNVGKMRNSGFDFSIGHQATWWNATFNGSHYKNKILQRQPLQKQDRVDCRRPDLLLRSDIDPIRQSSNQPGWPADRCVLWLGSRRLFQGCGRRSCTHASRGLWSWPESLRERGRYGTDEVQGREWRWSCESRGPDDHWKSASQIHGRSGPGSAPRKFRCERDRVWDVREQDLRESDGVVRVPRVPDKRSKGSVGKFVDASEPERQVSANRCQRQLELPTQQLLREGRIVHQAAQYANRIHSAELVAISAGLESVCAGRQPVHRNKLRRA